MKLRITLELDVPSVARGREVAAIIAADARTTAGPAIPVAGKMQFIDGVAANGRTTPIPPPAPDQ